MPVAIDHPATPKFRIVLRLARLVVTVGQQVVHVAEIVIRGPRPIVDGEVAFVDKQDLVGRADNPGQLNGRNPSTDPSRHAIVNAVAVLV